MFLIYLAAFIAACGAAKLDRTYLPPPSAALAGGSPGSLQVPLTRAIDQASQNVPPGGFINEHQGVVVEAAIAGTRASSQQSGLGGSRVSYGSTDSKVGDAAFRTPSTHQNPNHLPNFESAHGGDLNPDLSAFYQPMTSYRPGNVQIIRDYVSNTIKYHNDIDLNKFNYGFETNNGIKASESGVANNGAQVQGSYSYSGDDGRVYSVSYTADENGFRPHGSHLPTPPPIPIEILRSLEQNAKDEAAGIFDDGSYDAKKYNAGGDYTKRYDNGEYNDRQSNKFGKRPGSTDGVGNFINQNQQAFVTSNFNGQFGFTHDTSKDKYNAANDFNIMNNRNTFPKIEHNNQFINNGLGTRNEYLPPNRGQFESVFSAGGNKDSFSISQPILQQNLQTQGQLNVVRPNSFETSSGIFSQPAFNSQISSLPSNNFDNQGFISGFSDKNMSQSMALSEKPASSNILNQNPSIMQQSMSAPNNIKPIFTQDSFSQSVASVSAFSPQTQSAQQFLSTNSPLQSTQNLNIHLPTTQFSTASSGSLNPSINIIGQPQYAHIPVSSFDTSFSSVVPTGQPQITLSTLFEPPKVKDPFTLIDSGKAELLNATTAPDLTMTTQNIGLPTTQLISAPSVSFNPIVNSIGQSQYTHIPISSFDTSFSSVVPTVQPQITLSTPFEAPKTREPSTLIDSGKAELLNASFVPDFTMTTQNIGLPTTQLSSAPSVSFNPIVNTIGQSQYTHIPISSFDTSFSSVVPTVQPQITLSTPFEVPKTREPSTLIDSRKAELLNATTVPDFTMTTQNIRLPTTQLSSTPSGYFNPSVNTMGHTQYTNIPSFSTDTSFSSSSLSVVPTLQPQITLTTPFETPKREPSTLLDSGKTELFHATTVPEFTVTENQSSKLLMQTSSNKEQFPTQSAATISGNDFSGLSTSSFTLSQSTSQAFDNTQTTQISDDIKPQVTQVIFVSNSQGNSVSTNTQGPTYNGQTQAPDHSYTYKQPSIPFNTPFAVQQSNSGLSQVTQSLTTPQDSTSTTQYQTQSTFSNYPNPTTLIPNTSSYTLKENEHEKTSLQATNGITQASISSFPSIFTGSLSIKIPLQQSELSTPSQSAFPQPSITSATATTEMLSTTLDNQKDYTQNQLFVEDKLNDGINQINNEQYSSEIYQYDKPVQGLPPQPQKEDDKFSIKTERPQFAVSSSQFGQEGSTISMDQNNIQRVTQEPQTTFEAQQDSTVSEQSFSTRFSEQPSTQVTQADLNSNEYTISQSQQHTSPGIGIPNYKPTISFPSTVPSNTLNTDKLESQTSTTLSDNPTFELQSTSQFEGSSTKETTSSYFQQPNQQTETQFNYQSSTSISGASQTTPEIKEHTQFTTISQGFGTQSTAQIGYENFDNKATTMPQFQQSVTQFTYKPSTSISNEDHSTFSGANTKNPDKQFSFSTSFVLTTTDEPTQFSTQGNQGNFENKHTTISEFQTSSHQSSTTFSEPSTLIPSTAQTETPPGTTQFGEVYDYKKPTEGLITPSQNENNAQFNQVNQFGIQSNMGAQMTSILQRENPTQFAPQTQQPQLTTEPSTEFNQKVTEKETTQSHLSQSEAVTGIEYNTGSTLVPSLTQFQTTSNTQVPDQTSTTGEIYEYTKPEQGLTPQSQGENGQMVQKNQEQQIGERTTIPVGSTFETKQTTISQSTEAPTSTSATFQTQTSRNSQTTETLTTQYVFTQETLPETKPSDSPQQFAFYSACCKGFKTESNQSTTSANEVENIQIKKMEQVADMNKVEEKENLNLPVLQDAQKGSQTYAGIGEEFGGPRKPPSFDKTGYHY